MGHFDKICMSSRTRTLLFLLFRVAWSMQGSNLCNLSCSFWKSAAGTLLSLSEVYLWWQVHRPMKENLWKGTAMASRHWAVTIFAMQSSRSQASLSAAAPGLGYRNTADSCLLLVTMTSQRRAQHCRNSKNSYWTSAATSVWKCIHYEGITTAASWFIIHQLVVHERALW